MRCSQSIPVRPEPPLSADGDNDAHQPQENSVVEWNLEENFWKSWGPFIRSRFNDRLPDRTRARDNIRAYPSSRRYIWGFAQSRPPRLSSLWNSITRFRKMSLTVSAPDVGVDAGAVGTARPKHFHPAPVWSTLTAVGQVIRGFTGAPLAVAKYLK